MPADGHTCRHKTSSLIDYQTLAWAWYHGESNPNTSLRISGSGGGLDPQEALFPLDRNRGERAAVSPHLCAALRVRQRDDRVVAGALHGDHAHLHNRTVLQKFYSIPARLAAYYDSMCPHLLAHVRTSQVMLSTHAEITAANVAQHIDIVCQTRQTSRKKRLRHTCRCLRLVSCRFLVSNCANPSDEACAGKGRWS